MSPIVNLQVQNIDRKFKSVHPPQVFYMTRHHSVFTHKDLATTQKQHLPETANKRPQGVLSLFTDLKFLAGVVCERGTVMGFTRGVVSPELQISNRWKDRGISPERTKVWVEPTGKKMVQKKVAVVYYLTRNGELQQPHFMEVPLSNPRGLFLKDVITRLTIVRGEGMAIMYSWSCKRGYGNGFVWQDLTENDFIYPTNGHEYVLKGSELLHLRPPILNQPSDSSSSASSRSSDIHETSKKVDSPMVVTRRRNQSCSSIDVYEYKLYKTTENSVSAGESFAANASTQTGSSRHQIINVGEKESEKDTEVKIEELQEACKNETVELSRDEISPPPSDSSPETLETLMKADKRLMLRTGALNGSNGQDHTSGNSLSGKMKASTVLMQLISCGSFPFKDCGATAVKDHGLSLVSSYKSKLPRAEKQSCTSTRVKLEEKEYFSGSLIQNKTKSDDELMKLKRSFSCKADRDRKSRLGMEEVVDKIPRCTNNHQ